MTFLESAGRTTWTTWRRCRPWTVWRQGVGAPFSDLHARCGARFPAARLAGGRSRWPLGATGGLAPCRRCRAWRSRSIRVPCPPTWGSEPQIPCVLVRRRIGERRQRPALCQRILSFSSSRQGISSSSRGAPRVNSLRFKVVFHMDDPC